MMRIKADAIVDTPHAKKWEFEVQVYGRRYTIRCKIHSVVVPAGAQAGDGTNVFPHEHNHGNATVRVTVPDGVNKGDVFQVALAYGIDHEMSCPPELSEFISAGLMEDFDEFEETQGPVLYFCKKKQVVKKISDEKIRQEIEMKTTRIRNVVEIALEIALEMPLNMPLNMPRDTLLNTQPKMPLEMQMGSNPTFPLPLPFPLPFPFSPLPHSFSSLGANSPSAAGSRQDHGKTAPRRTTEPFFL